MRSETNNLKSEHQEKSKQKFDREKNGYMSPTYNNQRRFSASDDDISCFQPLKNGPNENIADIDNDNDDENENYGEGEEYVSDTDYLVQWTGTRKNMPVVLFRADAILEKESSARCVGEKYRLAFKIVRTECKIVRSVLVSHGFHEVHPNSLDFNVMWTGSHIKPYVLRGFSEFQKVNHFPRSYELTRKDRLCKNVQRMQHLKGFKHFDFIPLTFITPIEYGDFQSTFTKEKGIWIVKPVASSRGRGIFLINHPSQVPMDETLIVSRYISNPLLIDDFKFDIRLYVLVTSYDPMIIYLYEEGLARFASQKFDKSAKSVKNQFMHLTNYSVNKRNPDFVKNADPDLEDYGNKWSMSAMLRYLKSIGHDTAALMMRIEDLIVKTFLAGEMAIASASNMFQPFRGNCFELYGFDVLVDENMKPWLMEVNLSPSLACDAPIDLKIKANMVSDLFSVVGVTAQDPVSRRLQLRKGSSEAQNRNAIKRQRAKGGANSSLTRNGRVGGGAPFAGGGGRRQQRNQSGGHSNGGENLNPLTNEEAKILRLAREEYGRRGRWIRIFPTPVSWETYGNLMEHRTTHNLMLFTRLFPNGRTKAVGACGASAPSRPSSAYPSSAAANFFNGSRPRSAAGVTAASKMNSTECNETSMSGCSEITVRLLQYERRLMTLAETRAVSAANGNRRVNSESFALNVGTQHDTSGGAGAGSRNNLSGGYDGDERRRSRSRLPQGMECQMNTANGTGGAGSQQNRRQTRSLSSGARGTANTTAAVAEQYHTQGGNRERDVNEKAARDSSNRNENKTAAVRKRNSAPDDYRTTNEKRGRDSRQSKSSRPRSEMRQHNKKVAASERGHHHRHVCKEQQQDNDKENDRRSRRRNKYLSPADDAADVSKTLVSNWSGSVASYSRSGDRSRSVSSADTRTHSSRSSSSSCSNSSSSSSSFDTDNDTDSTPNSSTDEFSKAEKAKAQIRSLLEQGHIFTVTQARLAFAAYLVRVHRRLLRESQQAASNNAGGGGAESVSGAGGSLGALQKELKRSGASGERQLDNESSDAQMDLVLRFLKRAAQNLSQVFRVVVPSKKLSAQERRRILAKQLSDFVTIYSKDTNTISAQEDNKLQLHHNNQTSISAVKIPIASPIFQQFLEVSNENDLEEVLTLFTKINRSASIFLGGIHQNSPSCSSSSANQSGGATYHHHHHQSTRPGSLKGPHGGSVSTQSTERERVSVDMNQHDSTAGAATPAAGVNNDSRTERSSSCRLIQGATSSEHNAASDANATILGAYVAMGKSSNNQLASSDTACNIANEVSRDSTLSHLSSKHSTVGLVLDGTAHSQGAVEALAALHPGKRPPSGLGMGIGMGGLLYDKQNMYGQPTRITTGGGAHMEQPQSHMDQQRDKSVERRDRSVERELYLKDTKTLTSVQKSVSSPPVQSRVAFDSVATTNPQTRDQSTGGATPINRGKKTRPPFSAHMDQTARIYSENLSRTMIALNVGSGAHGSNSSSSVAGLSNKSQHSNHHQPITMTTSAGGAMVSQKSEEAINQALQRLAKRQATRQYSATNATDSIFKQGPNNTNNILAEDSVDATAAFDSTPTLLASPRPPPKLETPQWDSDDHATAYSLVTGVAPMTSYQATPGSTQYEVVKQQRHKGGGTGTKQQAASVVCATGGIFSRPNSGNVNKASSSVNSASSSSFMKNSKPVAIVKNVNGCAAHTFTGAGATTHSNDMGFPRPSTAKASSAASECSDYYNESSQVVLINGQQVPNNSVSNPGRRPQPPPPSSSSVVSSASVNLLAGHEYSPYYSRPTRAFSANRRAKANLVPTPNLHNHR